MKFLFPLFLFALITIALPVIIHLFNFRKFKKIYFTNVRFLKEVKQETQSKSQLKHLLVLFCRILAISFLVFAFAQPYIPSENKKAVTGDKVISIFLDNSFSMQSMGESGNLFEEARKKAKEIAGAYKPTDRFQLLTNDFEARHQRIVNKEEFLEQLDEVNISPAVKNISEIISRQKDLLLNQDQINKYAFLISDFQRSIVDFESFKNDTLIEFKLVPVKSEQNNNLYIDSLWFKSPTRLLGQSEELVIRVKNASNIPFEDVPLKLFINGQQKAPASINIEANSTQEHVMVFTINEIGENKGMVKITDYPISYDDDFYFSFNVAKHLPVLAINSDKESPYLNSLFGKDDFFVFTNVSDKNMDYSLLVKNKLIILNQLKTVSSGLAQELKKYVHNGGNIFLIPAPDMDIESFKIFLSSLKSNYYTALDTNYTKASRINLEHVLFKNVFEKIPENMDLPFVSSHFAISKSTHSNEEELIRLQNGNMLLSKYASGKGFVYLSAVALRNENGNFHKHALFVPAMYNIAMHSEPFHPLFFTIARDEIIESKQNLQADEIFRLISEENGFDIIPENKIIDGKHQLILHDQLKMAGNYSLKSGNQNAGSISFNYSRKESDLSYYSLPELTMLVENMGFLNFLILDSENKNLTTALEDLNLGKRLWKLCIIFALLFLFTEIILLRFLKK
ncbi:MAG: BatA domain-containing protein [Bacteroidetes bacterium]|nr:BatA domain-containing protein [Bacteroidota bacterium]HET6243071.1 BatA domain-containing protein [Bacteroidia bacterium]